MNYKQEYFYVKTLEELRKEGLDPSEEPTYEAEMNAFAIKNKNKKVLMVKRALRTYYVDVEIGWAWNIKWLKKPNLQLEFDFNS
jgi:hypothetical protein